jgi:hypothetical protein
MKVRVVAGGLVVEAENSIEQELLGWLQVEHKKEDLKIEFHLWFDGTEFDGPKSLSIRSLPKKENE